MCIHISSSGCFIFFKNDKKKNKKSLPASKKYQKTHTKKIPQANKNPNNKPQKTTPKVCQVL